MESIYYFRFQHKTAFVKLEYLFPECSLLIEGKDQLYPLKCLESSCPANANCMEGLAKRVHYFFDKVTLDAELIIAYFKYPDRPQSIRAGIFHRDMENPRVATLNPWAFKKFQKEGEAYKWLPPAEFYQLNNVLTSPDILPVENLLYRGRAADRKLKP